MTDRELFVAAVICGRPAVANVVQLAGVPDEAVPVSWVGAAGLIVSTARTMAELIDSGQCAGWAFAETYAEAEFIATSIAAERRTQQEPTCN